MGKVNYKMVAELAFAWKIVKVLKGSRKVAVLEIYVCKTLPPNLVYAEVLPRIYFVNCDHVYQNHWKHKNEKKKNRNKKGKL